ncbi:MAG: hypothetical protein ACRD8K_07695 [Nitrososphaeraceae archaeon]
MVIYSFSFFFINTIVLVNIDTFGIEVNNSSINNTGNSTFYSFFDSYILSYPEGYGSYQTQNSSTFHKNDTILLYLEPVGFSYKPIKDSTGTTFFLINFGIDVIISNKNGELLERIENIATKEIISHHKNKEVYLIIEFKPQNLISGKYYFQYFISDKNSGKNFEVVKDIIIL